MVELLDFGLANDLRKMFLYSGDASRFSELRVREVFHAISLRRAVDMQELQLQVPDVEIKLMMVAHNRIGL